MDKNSNPEMDKAYTEQTVYEFHETHGDLRLNGYEIATDMDTAALSEILQKLDILEVSDSPLNYETLYKLLKLEITAFRDGRQRFLNFLDDKFDLNTGKYRL